ncbi:MAG: hypothetical protein LWX83_02255 [Anaerolineae bacterium]|nr:hypothetical protein [Anaerolineae bacterium]
MMNLIRTYRALGPIDLKNIRRDAMLSWMVFAPLLLAFILRLLVPLLNDMALVRFNFDLKPYYGVIASFLFLILPVLIGMVMGFLLLDQRDDQTLLALQVTPLSLNGYLLYRISLPMLLSFVMTLIMIPLTALQEQPLWLLALPALCAAPLAPMSALFYASLAQNKVQGFAVMKASGALFIPPLIAYFVQSNWQWLFGLVPAYWPVKLYWLLQNGDPAAFWVLPLGLLYQAGLIYLLVGWFNRVMHTASV